MIAGVDGGRGAASIYKKYTNVLFQTLLEQKSIWRVFRANFRKSDGKRQKRYTLYYSKAWPRGNKYV